MECEHCELVRALQLLSRADCVGWLERNLINIYLMGLDVGTLKVINTSDIYSETGQRSSALGVS